MNELQVFQNPEFGTVRTMLIDNEPWAVGKDVAAALGYIDLNKAIARHVDEEDKLNDKTASSLGQRGGWLINESGIYSLILSSKLPSAKRFKRWVTSEILPALRKTGRYAAPTAEPEPEPEMRMLTPDDYLTAARIISSCRNERMPYVLGLLRKAGISIERSKLPVTVKDPKTAKLLTVAFDDYKVSARELEKRTGLHTAQLYRMRDGTARYNPERAAIIRDTVHALLPDLDIDAIYSSVT